MDSDDFKRIYSGFLRGVNHDELDQTYQSIFNKILQVRDGLGDDLINKAVQLVGNFTPEESKLAQSIFHDFLYISSFFGDENAVFPNQGLKVSTRYSANNVGVVFKFADGLIDLWPHFIKLFEGEEKLEWMKVTKFWTQFLRNGLASKNHRVQMSYYHILNESVFSINELFKFYPRAETTGINVVRSFIIQNAESFKMSMDNILDLFNDLQKRHSRKKMANKIRALNNEIRLFDKKLINENIKNMITGIRYTTLPVHCNALNCKPNPHYDEIARLVDYTMTVDKNGQLNVHYFFDWLIDETIVPMGSMLDEMIPGITVE